MTRRFEKKNKNPTLKLFLHNIWKWILQIYIFGKRESKTLIIKVISQFIYFKNNVSSHFFLKQFIIIIVLIYYLFQLIHPSGFCIVLIKKIHQYHLLKDQIHFLKQKQFYVNNTLSALQNNKTDTMEEFLIKNTGRQLNAKKITYLKEEEKK